MHKKRNRYRDTLKNILKELKINGCAICGYDDCDVALDFHHVNPEDKKFTINRDALSNKSLITELNKCILLCKNCHAKIEWRI
jgi:5-methylcytosine-specific restriction endonuclease McrA